jgi:hypothetical protein
MKDLDFMRLWDRYNLLLTQTQREISNLYFNCDLSLTEIAEEKACTKQGVSDCLNICRKKLEEYERKLHLCETYEVVAEALDHLKETCPERAEEIERISELLTNGNNGE